VEVNAVNHCTKLILKIVAASVLLIAIISLYPVWNRLYREFPEPAWVHRDAETRFMYASIGTERNDGIPYWIYYVLPRMFPEKLPGPGGYASLNIPWQQGYELPVGFTKKVIGYPRVSNNCALCHTAGYREQAGEKPVFKILGPGHTDPMEKLLRFFVECAKDPRFNADNILFQIFQVNKLDLLDVMLYRYVIIPHTKQYLLALEKQYPWQYDHKKFDHQLTWLIDFSNMSHGQ
jgi:hypothetical protein